MANKSKLTDEQVIELVNKYIETHPDAPRSHIITKSAPVSEKRIKALEAAGLIKLPKPLSRSETQHVWRKSIHSNVLERFT